MVRLSLDDYTVGWISALPLERAAAHVMLDATHDSLPLPRHDNNSYLYGSIGEHNVVMACLGQGDTGTSSATSVAKDMVSVFPSLRIRLMVGIGGGIPSDEHDIRLGDVVVSTPKGAHGGVVQYDFGKREQDKAFVLRSRQNQPPDMLLTAVSSLQGRHEVCGPQYPNFIKAIGERSDFGARIIAHSKYKGKEQDLLFPAELPHVGSKRSCEGCDKSRCVIRVDRDYPEIPQIHFGVIASGNTLFADATQRDFLSTEFGAICCEMEAAGLMNRFGNGCLVIRGISDYADSHKNDLWQGYAAIAAAAYAKELLREIPRQQVSNLPPVSQEADNTVLHSIIERLAVYLNSTNPNKVTRLRRPLLVDRTLTHQVDAWLTGKASGRLLLFGDSESPGAVSEAIHDVVLRKNADTIVYSISPMSRGNVLPINERLTSLVYSTLARLLHALTTQSPITFNFKPTKEDVERLDGTFKSLPIAIALIQQALQSTSSSLVIVIIRGMQHMIPFSSSDTWARLRQFLTIFGTSTDRVTANNSARTGLLMTTKRSGLVSGLEPSEYVRVDIEYLVKTGSMDVSKALQDL